VTLSIDPLTINDNQDAELVRLANVFHDRVRETFKDADVDLRANNYGRAEHNSIVFTIVAEHISFQETIYQHVIDDVVNSDALMRTRADFCVGRIKRMLGQA
jgi:hypothetical protein